MNKYLLVFVIVFTSCDKDINVKNDHISLSSPFYLEDESNDLVTSDYIINTQNIDSVSGSTGLILNLSTNKSLLNIRITKPISHLYNIKIWTDGISTDIPVFNSEKSNKQIELLDVDKKYQSVLLKGEFTNWQLKRLNYKKDKWIYNALVEKGEHQYIFSIDGVERLDLNNSSQISNGSGGFNSVLKVESFESELPLVYSDGLFENSFNVSSINQFTKALVYLDNKIIKVYNNQLGSNTVKIILPKNIKKGRSLIRVYVANKYGRGNDLLIPLHDGEIITNTNNLQRTDFHNQIMYFLMVDRFLDGDISNTKKLSNDSVNYKADYFGGDLQGVINKINNNYFTNLGINTIWLSPITQNPEGAYGLWKNPLTKFSAYHGYWPISNTKIDYRFGDDSTFKELITKAHDKNINVILDYVANHVHIEHPLYKSNPDWATSLYLPDGSMNTEKWDDHRLTTWFDTFLPTLDFSKREVVEKMTDSASYWLTNFDLDGFRHDATKHIQLDFWRTLTKKIKNKVDRPIFQIGETYGSPDLIKSYVNSGMLNGQFDFNLYDSSVQAFANPNSSFVDLSNSLKKSLYYYGYNHLMGNITGNQDRARFISYASGDLSFSEDTKKAGWSREILMSDTNSYKKLEMLHAFNLFIPGIPSIYYGDEYGSIGGNDPDNRKLMKFEGLDSNELKLKEKVTELINVRKSNMSILYGTTSVEYVEKDILVLKRKYFNQTSLAIFNKSAKDFSYKDNLITAYDFKIVIYEN